MFTAEDGAGLHPEWITVRFRALTKQADLPVIRLHDLRHSHATAGLEAGVPLKVMQERLGHASIAITADTYSHVRPELHQEAANRVADLILGTGSGG